MTNDENYLFLRRGREAPQTVPLISIELMKKHDNKVYRSRGI